MADNEPEGYAVPVRRSLTQPILLGGIPRGSAVLLLTGGVALIQAAGLMSVFVVVPACFAAYLGLLSAAKKDPRIQEVFVAHYRQPDRLGV